MYFARRGIKEVGYSIVRYYKDKGGRGKGKGGGDGKGAGRGLMGGFLAKW
jgi:hypothetical protein